MVAGKSFPVCLVSWRDAVQLSRALAEMIRGSFSPDLVVAIGRGGFVPARIVCDSLMLSTLTSIRVEHWGVAARSLESATIRYPLSMPVRGMDVLVVDDVTDTGKTLEVAARYLREQSPACIRTAVLHHKTCSAFVPDYYVVSEESWRWIVYPWALHEDLAGFCESVMGGEPVSVDDLLSRLKERYDMVPTRRDVKSALRNLIHQGRVEPVGKRFLSKRAWD
jgi:hypoxanthine phosphoribosyltransferase